MKISLEDFQRKWFTSSVVIRTQALVQKLLERGVILEMERTYSSLADKIYPGRQTLCLFQVKSWLKLKKTVLPFIKSFDFLFPGKNFKLFKEINQRWN